MRGQGKSEEPLADYYNAQESRNSEKEFLSSRLATSCRK